MPRKKRERPVIPNTFNDDLPMRFRDIAHFIETRPGHETSTSNSELGLVKWPKNEVHLAAAFMRQVIGGLRTED